MIAAIATGIAVAILVNLLWILLNRRTVAKLKKAHEDELYFETRKHFSDGFTAGWEGALGDFLVVKAAHDRMIRGMKKS